MGFARRTSTLLLAAVCFCCIGTSAASADGVYFDTPAVDNNYYDSVGDVPTFAWSFIGPIDYAACDFVRVAPNPTDLASSDCFDGNTAGLTADTSGAPSSHSFTWDLTSMVSIDGTYRVEGVAAFTSIGPQNYARSFTLDTIPPVVQLTGAVGYQSDRTPSWSFSIVDANPGTTRCGVDATGPGDNVALSVCPTSPVTLPELPDGPHTFWAVHTDLAGNQSHATGAFVVDTTAPTIEISGVSAGAVLNSSSVGLAVAATDAGAGVGSLLCSWGGDLPVPCSDPQFQQVELIDDVYTLLVFALDKVGNFATRSVTFTVDTGAGTDDTPGDKIAAPTAATFKVKRGSLKARRYYKPTITAEFNLPDGVSRDDCDGAASIAVKRAGKQLGKGDASFSASSRICTVRTQIKLAKKYRGKKITLALDYKSGPFAPFKLTSKQLKF